MISKEQSSSTPPLFGLVLAGGKSVRMGQDKSCIQWHGKEQRYYMADLLQQVATEVYISCRDEQRQSIAKEYKTISDSFEGAGPLIGLLSAFNAFPNVAWLVIACDLPLLDAATISYLVEARNINGIATTFRSPFDQLPEPLITIWEPSAFGVLKAHIASGYKCPRKALIHNEQLVKIIDPPQPDSILNANTPEDAERVRALIAAQ